MGEQVLYRCFPIIILWIIEIRLWKAFQQFLPFTPDLLFLIVQFKFIQYLRPIRQQYYQFLFYFYVTLIKVSPDVYAFLKLS